MKSGRGEGRIVASFRAVGGPGRAFLDRVRVLLPRIEGLRGTLLGWDALKVSAVFEPTALRELLTLVASLNAEIAASPGETAAGQWCVGIAEGDVKAVADSVDATKGDASDAARAADALGASSAFGSLVWGPPLIAASILADAARPGEVLCAWSVHAHLSGELVAAGTRVGRNGALRVRGARIDPVRPWRQQAIEQLAQMRVAPMVGRAISPASIAAGSLLVLRADPGLGGSRVLAELAAASPRALVIAPAGSGFEPLGALRRSLGRLIARGMNPRLADLAEPLDALLSGENVSAAQAAALVSAALSPKPEADRPSVLVIDDAKSVDPATLDACVRAAADGSFAIVVRLDASSGLPSVLASLPKSAELELPPLSKETSELLAAACTNDALDDVARRRWARLGGSSPLGIVEAITRAIATGEIVFEPRSGRGGPRSRVAGRGKVRSAAEWIALRAHTEPAANKTFLCLLALLGGEAALPRVARIFEAADETIDVDVVASSLVVGRWILDTEEDWIGLPSRTHREALVGLETESTKELLHRSIADVVEAEEGVFGRVAAGWHAGQARDVTRASRIFLAAARATADAGFEASTTQLIAFARRIDPACEEAALELLADALERSELAAESGADATTIGAAFTGVNPEGSPVSDGPTATADSEPPTIMQDQVHLPHGQNGGHSLPPVPSSAPGSQIAVRLGELAREALLASDNASLERWVDGLRAAGESPVFTERMRAMARLGRGDIGDALRVLRRARTALDPTNHALRCQTSLALAVALSVAGRPQEALLEGMDALARARQSSDEHGAKACLAFLAKLYTAVERPSEAEALRLRSTM